MRGGKLFTIFASAKMFPVTADCARIESFIYRYGEKNMIWKSRREVRALAEQFSEDIARMRKCLEAVRPGIDDLLLAYAWGDYSDSLCSGWMGLPDDDEQLFEILRKHLSPSILSDTWPIAWRTTIVDAGDDSEDGILFLPDELLDEVGWNVGDTLAISKTAVGEIRLRLVIDAELKTVDQP